jgi:hypothetical protein
MPYSDPKQNAEYQREWQRKRRSKKKSAADHSAGNMSGKNLKREPLNPVLKPPLDVRLRSADNLLEVLERAMAEVLACDSDTIARAKTVRYLVERATGLIKITDLVEKVAQLQKQVDGEASATNWQDASY